MQRFALHPLGMHPGRPSGFRLVTGGVVLAFLLFGLPLFLDLLWAPGPVWAAEHFEQKSNLRMSHKSHTDRRIRCEACHRTGEPSADPKPGLPPGWAPLKPSRIADAPQIILEDEPPTPAASGTVSGNEPPPAASPQVAVKAGPFGRPPEKLCLSCHYHRKSRSDCGLCHLGKPGANVRDRKRIGHGATFSHEKHQKTDCLECHPKAEAWDTLDGTMQDTSMAACIACHNGVKAKRDCTMCHEKTPRPADHGRNYERKHGVAWRSDPASCRMCHEDSSCLSCHARKPRDHTLAWTARRHGISAEANPDRCNACHSTKDTCRRCHRDW